MERHLTLDAEAGPNTRVTRGPQGRRARPSALLRDATPTRSVCFERLPDGRPARPTVVVATSDALLRRSLKEALLRVGLVWGGATDTSAGGAAMAVRLRPALLLLDLAMLDGDALDVVRRVAANGSDVTTVVLGAAGDADEALPALRAGANGYLPRTLDVVTLQRALTAVASGEPAIPRGLGSELLALLRAKGNAKTGVRPVRSPLTTREWEVFDLLCTGRSTDEIAEELVLSLETVRSHIKGILRKLGVHSRGAAVAMADRMRSSDPEPTAGTMPIGGIR